jgi:hypothetical protein
MPRRPIAIATSALGRSLAVASLAIVGVLVPAPAQAWEGAGLQSPDPAAIERDEPARAPTASVAGRPAVPAHPAPADTRTDTPTGAPASSPAEAPVRAASPAQAVAIEDAVFRLAVPFRTQKDGGRWQTSNCGPAILGMILDGFGVGGQATDDLRFRAHTYQGTVGMRTGTALEHIARVAEDFGVPTFGLYAAEGRFYTWTADEIGAQLRAGRPVMPLVRLYLLPGYEDMAPRWGHYILLTGIAPDGGFYYSDPLKTEPADGTARAVSATQLGHAMATSHIPGQAVAFGTPNAVLPHWTPAH